MVHGVAISDFDTITNITELQKDIEMFNPKLRLTTVEEWAKPPNHKERRVAR
jgi:hypothetical protein